MHLLGNISLNYWRFLTCARFGRLTVFGSGSSLAPRKGFVTSGNLASTMADDGYATRFPQRATTSRARTMSGAYPSSATRQDPRGLTIPAFTLFILLLSVGIPAQAMTPLGVTIGTTVDTDSITVGERLHVRYHIDCPDSLEVLPLENLDLGTCRLIDMRWDEKMEAGRLHKTAELEVFTLDLEGAHLPATEIRFRSPSGDTLLALTDEVNVPVRALAAAGGELKPLKEPWAAPADYKMFILAALVAVLIAIVLFLLWRRRKRHVVAKEPLPDLPADFIALRELRRIENLKLLEAGEFKKYYTLVTDAIRNYIERRFGVDALDRTTDEILFDLQRIHKRIEKLEQLLQEADLVKFAKYTPAVAAATEAMKTARDIVAKTSQKRLSELASSTPAGTSLDKVGSKH